MKNEIVIKPYHITFKDTVSEYITRCIHEDEELKSYHKKIDEGKDIHLALHQNTIAGICFFSERMNEHRGHTLDFEIFTDFQDELHDIYASFLKHIERYKEENSIDFIATSLLDKQVIEHQLLEKNGYSKWFVLKKMVHDGRKLPDHNLEYRHYEDRDFDLYFKGLGEAFTPMRTAMNITPHNVCTSASEKKAHEERESFLKEKDMMYVFFDQGQYVGAVTIAGSEIDDFYIVGDYQGKGYGRKIIEFAVKKATETSKQPVFLTVVDWNVKAKHLYQSIGFQYTETKVFYRKVKHNLS